MASSGPSAARIVLILPTLGLLGVVGALLLGLRDRPLRSAEVYGGPTDTNLDYSLRLHVREDRNGIIRDVPNFPIVVSWQGPTNETEIASTTGPDGWVEVTVPRPPGALGVDLKVVETLSGDVLARGRPQLPRLRWLRATQRRGGRLLGKSEGPVFVEARAKQGVLAVPFVGDVELGFTSAGGSRDGGHALVSAEGADLLSPARLDLNAPGAVISLRPREHVGSLSLSFTTTAGEIGSYFARLPVIPGASFIKLESGGIRVLSPLPRSEIWYAFVSEAGRFNGGRLPLVPLGRGESEGFLPAALVPQVENPYLVLSSSPDGRSPSTVGFPLGAQDGTFDARDGRLLDGATPRLAREEERRSRLRSLLYLHVGLVAFLTVVLFVLQVRSADRELLRRMERVGASELKPRGFATAAWIASLCLVVGFSLALVWISLSGGGV